MNEQETLNCVDYEIKMCCVCLKAPKRTELAAKPPGSAIPQIIIWTESLQQIMSDLQFNGFRGLSQSHAGFQ